MRRYTPARILLFLEAYCLLAVARLSLLCVPFQRTARISGLEVVAHDADQPPAASPSLPPHPRAQRVAWAIRTAAKRTPWESLCLTQALAGAWMLRRRRIAGMLYLGMRRAEAGSPDPMLAHAWLRTGHYILTGATGYQTYTVVARFRLPAV